MRAGFGIRSLACAILSLGACAALVAAQGRGQAPAAGAARAAAGDVRVLKVRDNVYMLSGDGGNVTVMTFDAGTLVVDTGSAQMANALLETIKRISPQPIAHIINTSASDDHTGGNAPLASTGRPTPVRGVP